MGSYSPPPPRPEPPIIMGESAKHYGFTLSLTPASMGLRITDYVEDFVLTITNDENTERGGVICVVFWYPGFANRHPRRYFIARLSPHLAAKESRFFRFKERHEIAGQVLCTISDLGQPELCESLPDDVIRQNATYANCFNLYTYRVEDKALYEEGRQRHQEVIKTLKETIAEEVKSRAEETEKHLKAEMREMVTQPSFKEDLAKEILKLQEKQEGQQKEKTPGVD